MNALNIQNTSSEYHTHQEKSRYRPQAIYIRSRLKNHTTSLDYIRTSEHGSGHSWITLRCLHCGYKFEVLTECGDRTCPICRKKWFGRFYNKILDEVERWDTVRTITLTVKNISDVEFSSKTIKWLRKCFKKLRRKYKDYFKRGFYVVHCTNRGNGWHPHLHVIYDGKYIPQEDLSNAWKEITGSGIVYIREAVSPKKAVRYLLSEFLGKMGIRECDRSKYNEVFRNVRMVQGFGECARMGFNDEGVCPRCGQRGYLVVEDRVWISVEQYWDTS